MWRRSRRTVKSLVILISITLLAVSAMTCFVASLFMLLGPSASLYVPVSLADPVQQTLPAYLQSFQRGWRSDSHYGLASSIASNEDDWNILYHLGGNGPWIEKIDGILDGGLAVPEGCEVDMVHMMSRHGERYPTKKAGNRMIELVDRIKGTGKQLHGALEFLVDWEYFTNTPDADFEQLTKTGPFSGVLEAFTTGVKLSTRYKQLLDKISTSKTLLWASECDRVIDTARYFSAGFFGPESESAEVKIISEDAARGGDTLTPGDTCLKYATDEQQGHDYGYSMLDKYTSTYLSEVSKRLAFENPGLYFTDPEIYSMQEMCGFEMLVRGHSKWCDVFTQKEWLQFEYARDVIHYYRAGPGNKYSRAMGWLWLNATTNLLVEGPDNAGPLYFSFVHDEDRKWATSQITPMGGRIIFERLSCPSAGEGTEQFIRFNVNDGIVPLPPCSSGPGGSCPLSKFAEYIKERGEEAGDFRSVCGLGQDDSPALTFLRQPGY